MFAFARKSALRPRFAFAAALLAGTTLGVVALEAPAHAQRNKKEAEPATPKADYSKNFVAAYRPVDELVQAERGAEAKPQVAGVVALAQTADDRNAAGGMLYNVGTQTSDPAMQLRGLDMMLASGRVDSARAGQYNFTAYQIANQNNDAANARKYLEGAIAADYSFEGRLADGTIKQFGADDLRAMLAELYFDESDHATGLNYLKTMIEQRAASGQQVPDSWIKRGLSVAYQNELVPQSIDFAGLYVRHYPSETSWADAIAIQRNLVEYDSHATLDLLRLAARNNALRDGRAYIDYIEAADARRLPAEVKRMLDQGIASGKLNRGDALVAEANQIASGRVAAEKADQPALERDARAPNATAVLATAAGDSYLSSGDAAKAEAMYRIALGKPGVDTARVTTRLGIALADQGKSAEAIETFGQVQGARAPIARLWSIHVGQKSAPAPAAVATTG